MLPRNKDLILQEKVKLYNNIAKIDNCEGRLLAELEIYPTPRIVWEFEIIGDIECDVPHSAPWRSDPLNSLKGYSFSIDQPICSGDYSTVIGPVRTIRGTATQALYGELENEAHIFTFYLPNTRFQQISICQGKLLKSIQDLGTGQEIESEKEGRYIRSSVDNNWNIYLDIRKDAIDWLNPQNRKIGTFVTTIGQLYQPKYRATRPETFSELQTITLNHALKLLKNLSLFLSYANGGYIEAIYIEGEQYTQRFPYVVKSCAVAMAYKTTPLEQLCDSWLTIKSNLQLYMDCYFSFEKMLQDQSWKDTFNFTLAQYLQATQPNLIAWQVRASAVGAALERLSYTILVEEETNTNKKADYELLFDVNKKQAATKKWNLGKNPGQEYISPTSKRLILLLERIGLSKSLGYSDIDDVPLFLKVRNDAVHPRVGSMTIEQRWKLINQAIQWLDEILLWRLGYSGEYLDRIQNAGSSTNPRYDLSLRDSSW